MYSVGVEDIKVMRCTWMPGSRKGTVCGECIEGYVDLDDGDLYPRNSNSERVAIRHCRALLSFTGPGLVPTTKYWMVFETSPTHLPPLATTSACASVLLNSLNFPLCRKSCS